MEKYKNIIPLIDKFIEDNKQGLIEDVISLINIDSVNSEATNQYPFGKGCYEALEKALEIGKNMGFTVKNYDNYCGIIGFNKQSNNKEISILAHLDVVPAGEGWTKDPFNAYINNNYIVGRGSKDDKGPLVMGLYALKCIKDLNLSFKNYATLFLGCNEEMGMEDVLYYLKKEEPPFFAITPDSCYPVCYGEKGILSGDFVFNKGSRLKSIYGGDASNMVIAKIKCTIIADEKQYIALQLKYKEDETVTLNYENNILKLNVKGISAHAAHPEGSVSALLKLAEIICDNSLLEEQANEGFLFIKNILSDYYAKGLNAQLEDEHSGKLTMVSGIVTQNENQFSVNVNVRYPVTKTSDDFLNKVYENIKRKEYVTFKLISDSKPSFVSTDTEYVKRANNVFNTLNKSNLKPFTSGGGTYARKYPNAFSFGISFADELLPRDIFKEGTGDLHQIDEAQNIDDLLFSLKVYILTLLELDEII